MSPPILTLRFNACCGTLQHV